MSIFLLIPIDVPSFKLIEGQIKELQGAENDQKSQGRIGLKGNYKSNISYSHIKEL